MHVRCTSDSYQYSHVTEQCTYAYQQQLIAAADENHPHQAMVCTDWKKLCHISLLLSDCPLRSVAPTMENERMSMSGP
eukprot:m.187151 g.187151  ORF g.187151 m.187151 type:complete len:78 (-) comp14768_c0_seq7:636-869(-)